MTDDMVFQGGVSTLSCRPGQPHDDALGSAGWLSANEGCTERWYGHQAAAAANAAAAAASAADAATAAVATAVQ